MEATAQNFEETVWKIVTYHVFQCIHKFYVSVDTGALKSLDPNIELQKSKRI